MGIAVLKGDTEYQQQEEEKELPIQTLCCKRPGFLTGKPDPACWLLGGTATVCSSSSTELYVALLGTWERRKPQSCPCSLGKIWMILMSKQLEISVWTPRSVGPSSADRMLPTGPSPRHGCGVLVSLHRFSTFISFWNLLVDSRSLSIYIYITFCFFKNNFVSYLKSLYQSMIRI